MNPETDETFVALENYLSNLDWRDPWANYIELEDDEIPTEPLTLEEKSVEYAQ